jgi:hypothetical protein
MTYNPSVDVDIACRSLTMTASAVQCCFTADPKRALDYARILEANVRIVIGELAKYLGKDDQDRSDGSIE